MRHHNYPTLSTTMTTQFLLALLIVLCSSHLISSIRHDTDNDSPLREYLVAVRRPDGLSGVEEPEALEHWHTYLLEHVCNTSDPATARYPTAASRLIYSYSHVVSGFSAWLTPQEVADMAMHPWFVEAIPDRKYKLMALATNTPQLPGLNIVRDGVWNKGNLGEGMIIGVLDAGVATGHLSFSPEGMLPPPAKWKGKCDYSGACNDKLIGLRSFVDTGRPQGPDEFVGNGGHGTHATSNAEGDFVQSASVLGDEYGTAFGVAPKAHLAFYHVCNDQCDPDAVKAAMDAAVDDGVDVISMSIGIEGDAVLDDDAVMASSYRAFARGVLMCSSTGSSGPDMFKVENAPWLLAVVASDTDRRVVTNVKLGKGILKPDVSAPGVSILAALPQDGVENTEEQIKTATSMAAAHVSGIATLIKKTHPEWSPAAIKSALITTADPLGHDMKPIRDGLTSEGASYFVIGAGEVNPVKAMDPGLVYNHTAEDFIPYLCGMKLGENRISEIDEPAKVSCRYTGEMAAKVLNYPSIIIVLDDKVQQVEAKRTVTNVGEPVETYRAEATAPGIDVVVNPATLAFTSVSQKMDFAVTVRRQPMTPAKAVIEGELKWASAKHVVQSPMVVLVGETVAF